MHLAPFRISRILAVLLKGAKSGLGRTSTFIGLEGHFPSPDSVATLSVNLAEDKKSLRSDRLGEFLRTGHIEHKELESITGRLSYSQTSAFGRFARCMARPLYRQLSADCYQSELSGSDRAVLQWWVALLMESKARRAISRNPIPDKIIYTDAADETTILAIVVFDKRDFDATGFTRAPIAM